MRAARKAAASGCIALGAMVAVAFSHAGASEYPNRSIRVVVPFAAAGVTDIVARILFDRIGQAIGQTIVIDDRPGAGGNIGVDQVAKSPPDGYTLVVADPSTSLAANVTLFPKLSFHPVKDLTPIAMLGSTGAVLIVTNSLPANSIGEFIALAKRKPSELMFGSTGNGTPGHLNGELFSQMVGIRTVHIPYRMGSQGTTDLMTGRIQFWIAPIPTRLEQINSGQLRALAVAGNDRSAICRESPRLRRAALVTSMLRLLMRCSLRRARRQRWSTNSTQRSNARSTRRSFRGNFAPRASSPSSGRPRKSPSCWNHRSCVGPT